MNALETDTSQMLETYNLMKNKIILLKWMNLSFLDQLVDGEITLLTAHRKLRSGTVRRFSRTVLVDDNPYLQRSTAMAFWGPIPIYRPFIGRYFENF